MGKQCERCGQEKRDVEFRNEIDLPEDVEEGYYCEECLNEMNDEWWEEESKAYIYDNEGNRADSPNYNSDNSWMEDRDD